MKMGKENQIYHKAKIVEVIVRFLKNDAISFNSKIVFLKEDFFH
jgi:hypothetical protein